MQWIKNTGRILICALILSVLFCFSGCEKKLTKEEIQRTEEYKDLKTKYSQLQRKYDKLKSTAKATEDATSSDAVDVETEKSYFTHIKKSNYVKVRYELCGENASYEVSDNASLCKWLKKQVQKAARVDSLKAEDLTQEEGPRYSYHLYNEDNSVCAFQVYRDNYVIFSDLPQSVYYVNDVSRIVEGSLHVTDSKLRPKQSLFSDLFHSQLVFQNNVLLSREDGQKVAGTFYNIKHKKLSEKPADVESVSQAEYIFKCDGDTNVMEVYDRYFSITRQDQSVIWYRSTKEDVKTFLGVLQSETE